MRIIAACALGLLLAGCASQADKAQKAAAAKAMNDCLVREEIAVAPKPVDLDTAARAVLTRCDLPGSIERPLLAQYPGYRDFIEQETQKRFAEMLDQIRGEIAYIRTR